MKVYPYTGFFSKAVFSSREVVTFMTNGIGYLEGPYRTQTWR